MVLETQPGFFIGPLFVYYYGVVYALAALSLYLVLYFKRKKLGLNETQVDTFVISALLGLLVGGRLFHFIVNDPAVFISNPLQLLMIREGGMSFFGAAIGVICATSIWYRYTTRAQKKQKDVQRLTRDSFLRLLGYGSVVIAIALIFGRLANFLNQELVGRIADSSIVTWCVEFATATGCRHPYQLYAAASHVILAIIVIIVLIRTAKSNKSGITLATFFMTYGILRFITDFWRDDPVVLVGLTVWQIFAIGIAIVGTYFLWRLNKHKG